MSQIYKNLSSGPLPPTVPTTFETDVNSPSIPAANILITTGGETTDNNLVGIQTYGDAGGNTWTVQLTNRATGQLSTNDATPTTIISFPLAASATVYVINGEIVGHNTTDAAGAAYDFTAGVITDGTTASLMAPPDIATKIEMAAMETADIGVSVSGNNLLIRVTGVAGKVVSWLAQFTYKQVV